MSGGMRSSDLTDDDYANLALTRRLIRRYLAFSERAAESAGLEPQHYQLLLMLRGLTPRGGAGVSDLSDWLQIRHHSAVGLVDRMQARGLVERRADPHNGRRVLVTLTRQGRSSLRSLAVLHRDELLRLAPDLVERLQQLVDSPRPEPTPALAPMTPL
jgi:DNA-binding MarR family transcriptional regulator